MIMMEFDRNKQYVIEGDTALFLLKLAERLYADKPLVGDERRDWANDLFNVHLQRIVEL